MATNYPPPAGKSAPGYLFFSSFLIPDYQALHQTIKAAIILRLAHLRSKALSAESSCRQQQPPQSYQGDYADKGQYYGPPQGYQGYQGYQPQHQYAPQPQPQTVIVYDVLYLPILQALNSSTALNKSDGATIAVWEFAWPVYRVWHVSVV